MDEKAFWRRVAAANQKGCMEWTGHRIKGGYGRIHEAGAYTLAHRKAWILTHGEIPLSEGHHGTLVVCHSCDNPPCCNPEHLFLGTQQANVADRDAKGRCRTTGNKSLGQQRASAKLTENDIVEIRQLRQSGVTTVALAKRYGVHHSVISRAARAVTWPHISNTR